MSPQGWAVVVPIKSPSRGKSRLAVSTEDRIELAQAIALDTLTAVSACDLVERVMVVTDDPRFAQEACRIPRVRWIDERAPLFDVNVALAAPMTALDRAVFIGMTGIGADAPRAALLGDLPSLRPEDLAEALRAAESTPLGVSCDWDGTGTTLLTAAPGSEWASSFGPGSFARHLAMGYLPLDIPRSSSVRRDVDSVEHLGDAMAIRVGARTAARVRGTALLRA